jgi:hypothetical protein
MAIFRIVLLLGMMAVSNAAISQSARIVQWTIVNLEKNEQLVQRSADILKEEIGKRSGIKIVTVNKMPKSLQNSVIICLEKSVKDLPSPYREQIASMQTVGKEGYKLYKPTDAFKSEDAFKPAGAFKSEGAFKPEGAEPVFIVGADPRGVLYGVGKLLRMMEIRKEGILLPANLFLASTPQSTVRGHQLGYRPKTNAYDAWTVAQMDQYIRELAIFGANSIEIMPANTDDDPTGPLLKLSLLEMAVEQSRICDSYGLDVWMWYPNMGEDYANADAIRAELEERREVFRQMPRLDAVFVPGGDPGELDPDPLFNFLDKVATVLHEYHPQAKIWVSPQVFKPTKEWLYNFYTQANKKYPWFGGIVFGPWVKDSPEEMRKRIDASIPIRHYPDITHSLACQYPVPFWDPAFIRTLGRECINPRPLDQKVIHNHSAPFCVGSISYSEGINDDVNKMIWSDQDWDSTTPVINTLRDYVRFFISPDYTEDIAQGILALEQNFKGNLLTNANVTRTFLQWKQIEEDLPEHDRRNYRFQLGLIRACYDEYIYRRLVHERAMESHALELLSSTKETDALSALSAAKKALTTKSGSDYMTLLRQKCFDLADSLFVNIGSQLTVEKHFAMSGRGNFMDYIDAPLSNAPWLVDQIDRISTLGNEPERLAQIHAVLNRTNPGPGGFYDNFGTYDATKRLLNKIAWEDDPGFLKSPSSDAAILRKNVEWVHVITAKGFDNQICPEEWMTQFTTFYENPLEVQYDGLDINSSYKVRVSYTGRYRTTMRLFANGHPVHDFIRAGEQQPTYEFKIPQQALTDGTVVFRWETMEGERGSQVAELWIIKD